MYAQHHRFQIWNTSQHPYSHDPSEFIYTNPGMPGVTNMADALDWINAVLYPNQLASVATPGDLPAAGNNINDYRVVTDDGDGKAASYRWEQREGDVAAKWYKIYDMDWGEQTVLSNFLNITQDVYVYKPGMDDLDDTGTAYAGDLSGQRIYGGASANTNLLLYANSGDGVGPNTGSIFAGDKLNPLTDNVFTLGEAGKRWSDVRSSLATIANISISTDSIVSAASAIDFGDNALSTTGSYSAGSITVAAGSITDSSGAISFGDEDLTTTGDISGTTGTFTSVVSTNITQLGTGGGPGTVDSQYLSGALTGVTSTVYYAQSFTATTNGQISSAIFKIRNGGAITGNCRAKLRTTTAGTIDGGAGAVLATSADIDISTIPSTAGGTEITFTFTGGPNLVLGTLYGIELDLSGASGTLEEVVHNPGSSYADGKAHFTFDGGATFGPNYTDRDMYFKILVDGGAVVNPTGVIHAVAGVYGASNVVNADIDAAAAIELSKLEALTADRAVLTDGSGVIAASAVTATELGYVSGVTSAIQTQLDAKANKNLSNLGTTAINTSLLPGTDSSVSFGTPLLKWTGLYANDIGDGTNTISTTKVVSFRNAVGTADGQTLFWNNTTNTWDPSAPDTEINHNALSNLTVGDVHTQYALLAGRSGGQTLLGSTVATEFLTLQGSSTSSGGVRVADTLVPDADLNGRNLGSSGLRWVNLYMSGELVGPRVENVLSTGLPASSGLNIGRMYYTTDTEDLMIDTGVALQRLSQENIVVDDALGWTGTETSAVYNVSASIEDARKALWAFYDVSDGYKEIKGAELTKSSTQVTVDVDIALPAGTYRLVGIR